jgi:small conductance mechanosensitive channel
VVAQEVPDSLRQATADTPAATGSGETVGELLAEPERLFPATERAMDYLLQMFAAFVPRLISALVVLAVLYVVYRSLGHLLRRILSRSDRVEGGIASLALKTYRIASTILIGIMVAAQFSIDVTALLAGLSIAGIAVGFAARDTLENFIAGITILVDKPFRIGDQIEVEGTFGVVDHITLRSTRLRTMNDQVMIMPNALVINHKVLNHTLRNTLRIEIPFGIAYKEYPAAAREVVLKLLEGDDRLDPDRPPTVVVTAMGESSVDMVLRFHIRDPLTEVPIRFEYVEKVREALRSADIEIPFPHLQLFIDGAKGLEKRASEPDA